MGSDLLLHVSPPGLSPVPRLLRNFLGGALQACSEKALKNLYFGRQRQCREGRRSTEAPIPGRHRRESGLPSTVLLSFHFILCIYSSWALPFPSPLYVFWTDHEYVSINTTIHLARGAGKR